MSKSSVLGEEGRLNLARLKERRKQKYQLRESLKKLDFSRDGYVPLRAFEVEAYKLGIYLCDRDMKLLL